ncbi:MAG TPA: DUF4956 domain-containing protein [Lacipirellulaceae bacterium]
MLNWFDLLRYGDPSSSAPIETVFLSLLVAFVIGQLIGWVYMATHTTPSYSSSFVASLVVLPVMVALMMILMAGSLMIAFGLLAVFAVVRFRNVLKDTRDTTYILWAIVEGMAVGTFRYSTGLVGAAAVILVLFYLWLTEFGVRHRFDAALSVSIPGDSAAMRERVEQILHRFSDRTILTGERLSPDARNILSYRLLLRDPAKRADLRSELSSAGDVHELSFYLQDDESEV